MKKVFILLSLASVACRPTPNDKSVATTSTTTEVVDAPVDVHTEEVDEPVVYHATETVFTDLINTKLEVSFDWSHSRLMGKETLTAKPHFYSTDSLVLDAKGMEIKSVTMNGAPLVFAYADEKLTIRLDRVCKRTESYTVVIDYVSMPDEWLSKGSKAITSDKGLYFINPKGEDKFKMPQIWTQGETEASSVWFPTIDAPNVKTKQEIYITVDDKYTTLSNGKLVSSKKNADGTRTDYWKQELPHAPYLFMMGVGQFKVVKDSWKRADGSMMEVSYYVEPEWEPYARNIFGETPAMIGYFSKLLGVEYKWDKYSQIVVRDYVSGAMENTGAVVFGDYAYKTDRDLLDGTDQSTIAHELFHHWFGDLVTAESWSNLTLNESFADYSQYLWDEHRYGLDEADYQAELEGKGYYASTKQAGYHDLVWYDYESQEDMFDQHSYNKGGRILHMLRNHIGDEAFFAALNLYLTTNAFKAAEFHQLRQAFEEVSGQDLNWFFNQWYLASGNPSLELNYKIDDAAKTVVLTVEQKQDTDQFPVFRLPVDVVVYDDKGETTHRVVVDGVKNEFTLPFSGTLKNVLFDKQCMLLAEITDNKPDQFFIHQYYNGKRYLARKAGLVNGQKARSIEAEKMILDALSDPFWDIRLVAIDKVGKLNGVNKTAGLALLKKMAASDSISKVRASAINVLSTMTMVPGEYQVILEDAIKKDKSYLVITTALTQLAKVDAKSAMAIAKNLENEKAPKMIVGIARLYGTNGSGDEYDFFAKALSSNLVDGFDALAVLNSFTGYLSKQNLTTLRKSVSIYEYQSANGDMYTKMFLPQHMTYLADNLNQQITKFQAEEDKAKKDGNTNAAEIAKANRTEAEALIKAFNTISVKLNRAE